MFSHSFLLGRSRSELQFIDDLINLCKRHQIGCGDPQDLDHLATDLLFNDDFRIDLFTLCTAIGHMAEVEPPPEQLLILVACAFGGPAVSIRDVTIDVPHSASSAFLNGFEAWSKREPEIAESSSWTTDRSADRDQLPSPPPPRPTLYFAAASRSESDSPQTHEEPSAARSPADAPSHISIPPNTTIENLTLTELRMYLEDIENRVSRIEPKIEHIAPQPYFSPEYFEQLEALDDHKVQKAKPHAIVPDHEPTLAPRSIVPVTQSEPSPAAPPVIPILETDSTLPSIPYAPVIVPYQTAVAIAALSPAPGEIHHAPSDVDRLRQLRFVNVLLIFFLAVTCCLTVFFAYRYLTGHPPSFADTINRFPHPLDEQSSDAATADHASPQAAPLPPATLFIPNPAYNTVPAHTTHSPRTSSSLGKSSPDASTPGKNISTFPVSQFPQPRPSISDVYPDQNPEQSNDHSAHPATFASSAPSPSSLADTSTAPPSTSATVSVPSTMMMTYAIAAPKPVYPSFRHIGTDSTVDVETTISKDGRVIGARALDGTLDVRAAAVEAVLGWRFKPFLVDGKPVGVVTTFKFVFKGH